MKKAMPPINTNRNKSVKILQKIFSIILFPRNNPRSPLKAATRITMEKIRIINVGSVSKSRCAFDCRKVSLSEDLPGGRY